MVNRHVGMLAAALLLAVGAGAAGGCGCTAEGEGNTVTCGDTGPVGPTTITPARPAPPMPAPDPPAPDPPAPVDRPQGRLTATARPVGTRGDWRADWRWIGADPPVVVSFERRGCTRRGDRLCGGVAAAGVHVDLWASEPSVQFCADRPGNPNACAVAQRPGG